MPYDHRRVQRWVESVALSDALGLWGVLLAHACSPTLHYRYERLVEEFRASSGWEAVNMLYGLRDLVERSMQLSIDDYTRGARRGDDEEDEELQQILRGRNA